MTLGTDPALPCPGTSKSPDGVGGGLLGREGWMVTVGGWSVWTAGPVALEMVSWGFVLSCPGDGRQGLTAVAW